MAEELPKSIYKKFEVLEDSLDSLQNSLQPFLKLPVTDVREKIEDPLENAKLDLMVAYTANSLFWTYLITQGVDPKTHPVKDELLRIKEYMNKIRLAEEKKKMARVDTSAAKRFVRNALWEPSSNKESDSPKGEDISEQQNAEDESSGSQNNTDDHKEKKRKTEDKESKNKDKKKKKKKKKD